MPASRFVLRHDEIEIVYTTGATPGVVALTYHDGYAPPKGYMALDVATDKTAAGTFVSVPLQVTTDVGGQRFGFFLPELDAPSTAHDHVETVGVYQRFTGPDSVPHGEPSWRCVRLHGTVQPVILER